LQTSRNRDIKPGNILLGPYGETLVVDWGLAKIVGRDEPTTGDLSAEPTLRPPSASDSGETIPGTALGTPAYMSPEQAQGRLDLLGPQSDVYSLGATLYVLLTGRPPFTGDDAAAVLPSVQRGEFTRPRVVNSSIPKPLEAISLKAMARKPADRYATPRALAEDIEHWLADEPVTAYREPWPDRARRWSRKHRTLVTSAAAVLLLGLLGSVGFAAVVTGKNRELARQTQRAEAREQMAIDAVKRFRDVVVEEPVLKNSPALKALRNKLLKAPLAFFQSLRAQLQADQETRPEALARLAEAAHDYAHVSQEIGDIEDSLRSHVESLAIWEKLVREQPAKADYQRGLATIEYCRAKMLSDTGHPDQGLESHGKALAIRERLARENPSVTEFQSDLARSHNNIGALQSEIGHPDQALESYGKALAIQERLARDNPSVTEFQSGLGATLNNMATIDVAAERFEQAREKLRQAISWQKKALAANPRHPIYRQFLRNHLTNLIRAAKALGNDGDASAAQRDLDELAATDPAKAALDTRMGAVLRGELPRDNGERLQLAYRAYEKKLYAVSMRLFGDALDADPKLADDRRAQHRYNAACAAVLAATTNISPVAPASLSVDKTGGGAEKAITDADRTKLRNQARTWLEAELATWTKLVESAKAQERQAIAKTLEHWQQHSDLASVRDAAALAKLHDDERKAWKSFWANVAELLAKARKP
jgi:tetratricopeptide (TPR) repeat protein